MFKKTLLAALVSLTSFSTFANLSAGISYINASEDADGFDISVGMLVGSIGYKHQIDEKLQVMPELRLGFGISDDTVRVYSTDVTVEVNSFTSFSLRGQYAIDDNAYVFLAPTYSNLDFEASSAVGSASEDEWDFGVNAGVGYKFSNSAEAEVSFEDFEGTSLLSLGIRTNF